MPKNAGDARIDTIGPGAMSLPENETAAFAKIAHHRIVRAYSSQLENVPTDSYAAAGPINIHHTSKDGRKKTMRARYSRAP
jgi:hypothetical protein